MPTSNPAKESHELLLERSIAARVCQGSAADRAEHAQMDCRRGWGAATEPLAAQVARR